MSSATFTLSAFGDEIADDLQEQINVLRKLQVRYLDLRGVWGKNVLHLDDDQVDAVRKICSEQDVRIGCIGSPIGKSPLVDPVETELSNLTRIIQIAAALDTRLIRVFSFYPPNMENNDHYDQHVEAVVSRLAPLTETARREGVTLLLENEKRIIGDTPERCQAILSAIDSPHLRFAWDPANFIEVGVAQPTDRGWSLLGPYTAHVHIKDALLNGGIRPAGEGQGQVGDLLAVLREDGYQGFLALEPHLTLAAHSHGFSGPDGMARAVTALRQLMTEHDCKEG